MLTVRLQSETFDPGAETNAFLKDCGGAGAAVTFTGLVRSLPGQALETLELEHYPAMAKKALTALGKDAIARFGLMKLTMIHRFGRLLPEEPIVQVMALSAHRQAAFDGANFVMDVLKTDAPFWKKETASGRQSWVDARSEDDAARTRWQK